MCRSLRGVFLLLGALASFIACGDSQSPAARADLAAEEGVTHPMVGLRAPEFVGDSLTPGGWLPLGGLRTTPIAILFFQPGAPFAAELVREFDRFRNDRSMAPTRFMGIVRDTPEAIEQFQRVHRTDLPILRDPGSINRNYGIGSTPTIVLLDVDHIVRFRLDGFVGAEFRPRLEATEEALRELPRHRAEDGHSLRLEYGPFERLPDLIVRTGDGRGFHLVDSRGRVTVLMFLESACSWCGDRLTAIMEPVEATDPGTVSAIAVVIDPPDGQMAARLQQSNPRLRILTDPSDAAAIRFPGIEAPALLLVDREGFVRYRAPRDLGDDEAMAEFRRHLALALADAPPSGDEASSTGAPLLSRVAHVGDNVCRECHQEQYMQWRTTPHAAAITPLVQADRASDDSCTPCHTTGAGLAAGFGDPLMTASMTNVQCEVCHGPGFDHVNAPPDLRSQTIYGLSNECRRCDIARLCVGCHDDENDPDFDLATALPKVTH